MSSADIIRSAPVAACRPWPRYMVPTDQWLMLAPEDVSLHAFWADTAAVYALFTSGAGQILLASTAVRDGDYPALSPRFASAILPERMVQDLWGHRAMGGVDPRPWLDHGRWSVTHPLAPRHGPATGATEYAFRAIEDLMQIPVGPVLGHPAEPVHFRIHAAGEVAASVEARLGYAHKGTLLLMRGKSPRTAARFAARLSADATVAHSVAFARAAEAAMDIEPPPRAVMLRGVMAEAERIATHLGDLVAACGELPHLCGRLGWHREQVLRSAQVAFGHRMMMDCVVPGGLAGDILPEGATALRMVADGLAAELPNLVQGLGTLGAGIGIVPPASLEALVPVGLVARAAGCSVDARQNPGYPPYPAATPPTLPGADAAARLRLRLHEITISLDLLRDWLGSLPTGPVSQTLPNTGGEGIAVAESPRGAVWHWLRLDGGLIASAFAADPSWRLWPMQEAASAGALLADLTLIDRSFACARSGVDL
ncbi:nickel-dependent hydrogenase large subunit [Acidisphaera sp. L21]|uniref:hydrogenase large subunit n=1 Tax=Acidisphaera sp. L21 TaxID=1641851 RepID=UPI00131DC87C|nr:nickel-dependent hydrogenase large subunit [Acidisphaera sp. L21]